jgi:hypothetical protein
MMAGVYEEVLALAARGEVRGRMVAEELTAPAIQAVSALVESGEAWWDPSGVLGGSFRHGDLATFAFWPGLTCRLLDPALATPAEVEATARPGHVIAAPETAAFAPSFLDAVDDPPPADGEVLAWADGGWWVARFSARDPITLGPSWEIDRGDGETIWPSYWLPLPPEPIPSEAAP